MPVSTRARVAALVEDLGSQSGVARTLRVDRSRVNRWLRDEEPDPQNRRKVELLEVVMARLLRLYDQPTAANWLEGTNAQLGNRRPADFIAAGRITEVLAAIDAEEAGSFA